METNCLYQHHRNGIPDMKTMDPSHPQHRDQLISTNGRRAERIWDAEPLDKQIVDLLTAACLASNKEVCGFIVDDEDIFYVANCHQDPRHNFLMDPASFEQVVSEIYDIRQANIIGLFHTHPNNVPWPTPRDLVGWPNPALGWRYWIVTGGEVIEWRLICD
jgi:proteasome lid subunit RPN8/RPN11